MSAALPALAALARRNTPTRFNNVALPDDALRGYPPGVRGRRVGLAAWGIPGVDAVHVHQNASDARVHGPGAPDGVRLALASAGDPAPSAPADLARAFPALAGRETWRDLQAVLQVARALGTTVLLQLALTHGVDDPLRRLRLLREEQGPGAPARLVAHLARFQGDQLPPLGSLEDWERAFHSFGLGGGVVATYDAPPETWVSAYLDTIRFFNNDAVQALRNLSATRGYSLNLSSYTAGEVEAAIEAAVAGGDLARSARALPNNGLLVVLAEPLVPRLLGLGSRMLSVPDGALRAETTIRSVSLSFNSGGSGASFPAAYAWRDEEGRQPSLHPNVSSSGVVCLGNLPETPIHEEEAQARGLRAPSLRDLLDMLRQVNLSSAHRSRMTDVLSPAYYSAIEQGAWDRGALEAHGFRDVALDFSPPSGQE